jgi:hypothetical protein
MKKQRRSTEMVGRKNEYLQFFSNPATALDQEQFHHTEDPMVKPLGASTDL